jgi:hypothetical protein
MSLLCVYLSKRGKGVGIGGERRPKDMMKREGYFRDNFNVLQNYAGQGFFVFNFVY